MKLFVGYHEQFSLQTKVFKLVALGVRHVGGLLPPVLGRQLQLALPPVQVLNLRRVSNWAMMSLIKGPTWVCWPMTPPPGIPPPDIVAAIQEGLKTSPFQPRPPQTDLRCSSLLWPFCSKSSCTDPLPECRKQRRVGLLKVGLGSRVGLVQALRALEIVHC